MRSRFCPRTSSNSRVAALAVTLLLASGASALDPARTLTQYAHRIWGVEQGLAQPTIYSILQTRNGYLWLGTQDSLVRFDGSRFRQMDDLLGAPFDHHMVRSLLEDDRNNLWVGTMGSGLIRRAPDGSVTQFGKAQGMPSDNVACLASDHNQALWICTDEGLVRKENGHVRVFTTADGMPSNHPNSFCVAEDGSGWAAYPDYGLVQIHGERATPFATPLKAIQTLACAKDGSVWAGTEGGLFRIRNGKGQSFTTRDGLADNWISALTEGPDGSIWIGTHAGFSRYRPAASGGSFESFRPGNGLSHSTVLALSFDREGSLWVGTKNGLDQFTDGNVIPYTTSEGMPGNDAGPVIEDAGGRLWVGTLRNGLGAFDGTRFRVFTTRDGLSDNSVLSLENGRNGDLWVGTKRGISRVRGDRVISRYSRKDGLSGNEARAMFFDSEGVLWVGTESGLDAFNGKRFIEHAAPGIPHIANILAVAGGSRTRLFVSAEPNSMYQLRDGVLTHHSLEGISRPVTSFYLLDREKHIAWMGTLGSGLLRWQNGNVVHVYIRDGLYDNRIYSILPDGRGNLWIASSKGIFRVSVVELENFAGGRIHRIQSLPFTTGQLRFECQPGVQPEGWRAHDGRLWFSTTTGLVVIDPENLMTSRVAPPVAISSVLVNGQRVTLDGALNGADLKSSQRNLEIRYSGLSFVSPEKVTFRYILEGYDKTWNDAGARREAFYTNLPPGRFRFRVAAKNADGVGSEKDATLVFAIAPRLFQRVWFWPMILSLIAVAATALYRLRVRRLRAAFNLVFGERSRIARELHDTLLQGLSGVMMQLEALRVGLPQSTARETLAEIIEDARRCSSDARRSLFGLRMVDGISDGGFSGELTRLVKQTMSGSSANLILEIEPLSLDDAPDLAFQLLRIVQEAVSNAVRHAGAETIRVALRIFGGRLELAIEDDGVGFDPEASCVDHYGVAGIRERSDEIGAKLKITSTAGLGTQIFLTVAAFKNLTYRFRRGRLKSMVG